MPYLIIGVIVLIAVGWGVYKSKKGATGQSLAKANRPQFRGPVRRFSHGGKQRIQTDEQRSEVIMNSRQQYDPSIDRLDPRHPDYRERGESPSASS
ncbi:MAG TPA: hypothetical protein VGS61_02985 [Acidimicrobiales bacterium]|nr:hypothetical protein [Acidimicrobiales bacterium]